MTDTETVIASVYFVPFITDHDPDMEKTTPMTVVVDESLSIIPGSGCRPYGRTLSGTTGFSCGAPFIN
jgi:hypothetical protein